MSLELVITSGILAVLGKTAFPIFQRLIDNKLIVSKGVTIYHASSEIEYAFLISLGPSNSRVNIAMKKIQGILNKPVEFQDVIDITGYGLPYHDDLRELGVIIKDRDTATIDFGKMFK